MDVLVSRGLEDRCHKLFLALALTKTKPTESSFADYLVQFRESMFREVHERDRFTRVRASEVAYWKNLHAESEAHFAELKEKFEALERQHADMTSKLAMIQATPKASGPQHTQQQPVAIGTPTTDQLFSQTEQFEPISVLQDNKNIQIALDELEIKIPSPDVNAYFNHVYLLLRRLHQPRQHQGDLNQCIVQLSRDACKVIQAATRQDPEMDAQGCEDSPKHGDTSNPPLEKERLARVQLIRRTFDHIAKACRCVATETLERAGRTSAVFHVAQIFEHLLDAIPTLAVTNTHDTTSAAAHQTKVLEDIVPTEELLVQDIEVEFSHKLCAEISSTFVHMISALVSIEPVIGDIINAALHALLLRIGHLLNYCLHEDFQEVPDSQQPDHKLDTAGAKSMVWILKRTIALLRKAHSKENSNNPELLPTESTGFEKTDPHAIFSNLLEASQNTLLHTIFSNDELFVNGLTPIHADESEPTFLQDNVSEDCTIWFESEIWRLFYWVPSIQSKV